MLLLGALLLLFASAALPPVALPLSRASAQAASLRLHR